MSARPGVPVPTRRWLTLERAGVRIALIGLSVPMFTRGMWSQVLCDYLYEDPVVTARALVRELRPQYDLLVALTHLGLREDQALAASVPEIDVVIGGHSHSDLEKPVWVGRTPILHTTAYAASVGRACLERDAEGWRLATWERLPLQAPAAADSEARAPGAAANLKGHQP
jgi:2',3'-cyclic-nucleotide 2'-phosphodiesterase (5'-nucleotidase family)